MRSRTASLAIAAAACAIGCKGNVGTIQLRLTTAPGSTIMDGVDRLRVMVTNPRRVVEATRTDRGFDLVIDLDATGTSAALVVEGLDRSGALIATGMSPSFPVSSIEARIVIYMAAPLSIGPAPVALATPRNASLARLPFGAVYAGGLDANGAPSDSVSVYNAFDHTLVDYRPMPEARAGVALGVGSRGAVYLFGGTNASGVATGTLWRFDGAVPPSGMHTPLGEQPGFARANAIAIPIGVDRFAITGAPVIDLEPTVIPPRFIERGDVAAFDSAGAARTSPDGVTTAVVSGGSSGIFFGSQTGFRNVVPSTRTGVAIAAIPPASPGDDDRFIVLGGDGTTLPLDAILINAVTGAVATIPNLLATGRRRPAVAATSRHLVVAGGLDLANQPIATAEIFDANSLVRIATVPIRARAASVAIALANDQIMIGGGTPVTDQIELFTPPPPPL